MKKGTSIVFTTMMLLASAQAPAFWGNNGWSGNDCWHNPYNCNPYDVWDPRYWMEEFSDMWDDDDYYGPYGYGPYGGYGGGYGAPYMPYGAPYGYPNPAPYVQQNRPQTQPTASPATTKK